jgi:hypothetical protein
MCRDPLAVNVRDFPYPHPSNNTAAVFEAELIFFWL